MTRDDAAEMREPDDKRSWELGEVCSLSGVSGRDGTCVISDTDYTYAVDMIHNCPCIHKTHF